MSNKGKKKRKRKRKRNGGRRYLHLRGEADRRGGLEAGGVDAETVEVGLGGDAASGEVVSAARGGGAGRDGKLELVARRRHLVGLVGLAARRRARGGPQGGVERATERVHIQLGCKQHVRVRVRREVRTRFSTKRAREVGGAYKRRCRNRRP